MLGLIMGLIIAIVMEPPGCRTPESCVQLSGEFIGQASFQKMHSVYPHGVESLPRSGGETHSVFRMPDTEQRILPIILVEPVLSKLRRDVLSALVALRSENHLDPRPKCQRNLSRQIHKTVFLKINSA